MQKPSPEVPNPYQVARAQSAADIRTAKANTLMGNADEVNPYGSVDYKITDWKDVGTGHDGNKIKIPIYTRTVSLADAQREMLHQQNRIGINLNETALKQSNRIDNLLSSPILEKNIAPDAVTHLTNTDPLKATFNAPDVQLYNGNAPRLANTATTFGDAGDIQRSIGPTNYADQRKEVEDAIYSRLNPQLERDKTALEARLVNQGFARGSAGFREQMDEFNRQSNDARMQAVLAGGGEQSRLAGLALQSGNFTNAAQGQAYGQALGRGQFAQGAIDQNNKTDLAEFQAGITGNQQHNATVDQAYKQANNEADFFNRTQDQILNQSGQRGAFQNHARAANLSEQFGLRNQPINEISALMNGGQVTMPQFPQFNYTPMSSVPVGQYVYQSAAMQNQANAASMGGLYGLGSSLLYGLGGLMGSDRRLKKNITELGASLKNGAKLYAYEYLGEAKRRVGVMADELEKVMPGAVHVVNGFRAVDYNMLMKAA